LGPQHGLPHNCTPSPVGLGHQLGHKCVLNDDSKTKQNRDSTLSTIIQSIETTEVKTAVDRGRRGRHYHTERATIAQDPTPQCCCTRNWPPGGMQTPSQKQTLACAGTSNPPLSTPLSLVRRDRNPPHGSTLQTHLKDSRHRSTKRCPALGTESSCRPPQRFESSSCFPLAQTATIEMETEEVACASFDVVSHRGISAVLRIPTAIRRRPSLPWLQVPPAPSQDVVPHRTGECQATLGAAERSKR
jgi:hypothetical protein